MINLAIDTNCLRNDPARKKAAFHALKKLANAGELRLHISQVVQDEFISQQMEQYDTGLSELCANLAKLKKKHLPDEIRDHLNVMQKSLTGLNKTLATFAITDFNEWVSDISAEIHPIIASHGLKVMEAYFSGAAPFRKRKQRGDIPDAFIWQVIIDLKEHFKKLYVISNDGAIQIASEAHPNIVLFKTLDEFISSEICQPPLNRVRAKSNLERILVMAPELLDEIKSVIESEAVDALHGKTVNSEHIPEDNNEATIMLTGDIREIEILTDDAEYYGSGVFVFQFNFYSKCLLNYAIFKADLYVQDYKKANKISVSDLNDHYFDAEEYYDLLVKGVVAIDLGSEDIELEDLSEEQLNEMVEDVVINLDSINEIEIPFDDEY